MDEVENSEDLLEDVPLSSIAKEITDNKLEIKVEQG